MIDLVRERKKYLNKNLIEIFLYDTRTKGKNCIICK